VRRFDNKGRLVFPDFEKLGGVEKAGVMVEKQRLHITRAFCPKGHPLITENSEKFNGHPGIRLWVKGKHREQTVTLSPFQGDSTKVYVQEFEPGEVLDVRCSYCRTALPVLAPCGCQPDSSWIMLYLNPTLEYRDSIGVCNAWGCPRSYTRLSGEILTEYRASIQP
jgi:hypothetical protein